MRSCNRRSETNKGHRSQTNKGPVASEALEALLSAQCSQAPLELLQTPLELLQAPLEHSRLHWSFSRLKSSCLSWPIDNFLCIFVNYTIFVRKWKTMSVFCCKMPQYGIFFMKILKFVRGVIFFGIFTLGADAPFTRSTGAFPDSRFLVCHGQLTIFFVFL